LRAGDILLLVNGKTVVVEQIQHEILERTTKVYNFTVADNHNYFVGESVNTSNGKFVLAHNTCQEKVFTKDQQALIELAKENTGGVGLPEDQANILVDWANEYGLKNHAPAIHEGKSGFWSSIRHIRIFKYHIKVV
jgi:hypothetical protein